jgi:hypothetical protein
LNRLKMQAGGAKKKMDSSLTGQKRILEQRRRARSRSPSRLDRTATSSRQVKALTRDDHVGLEDGYGSYDESSGDEFATSGARRGTGAPRGITTNELRRIFVSKCEDLDLNYSAERESRFIHTFQKNCAGDVLDLRESGVGPRCAQVVASVLSKCNQYSVINLSGNLLRDPGTTAIARCLQRNVAIRTLDVRSNNIGVAGGVKLAEALEVNGTLDELDLSGISGINRNHIGTAGCAAMGKALALNESLRTLYISSNGIGGEGVTALAEARTHRAVFDSPPPSDHS